MSLYDEPQSLDENAEYAVTKTSDEKRYTLGVMYIPNALDSDDEFTDADALQKACWAFVKDGSKRIRDTHTKTEIGDLVELVSWPFPVEVDLKHADGSVEKRKLPANTVFAGVVWDENVWPLVKSGKLRGYSMGGKAMRMKNASAESMPKMKSLVADASPVTKDGIPVPNKPGAKNWVEETGGLPPYIRKIAEDLIATHGVSGAIRLAVGAVKRWARGGGNVKPDTRAKAAAAVAQWEKMKAQAHLSKAVEPEFSESQYSAAEYILRASGTFDED